MVSSALPRLFEDYASYHRHPMNKLCHYVGVPMIVITLVGLLSRVPLGPVSLAVPVAIVAVLVDLRFSVRLTIPFALLLALSFPLTAVLSTGVLWALFVLGWVFQLVGHYVYEKKSPAFVKNLEQLLIGPLWLVAQAISRPRAPGWSASDKTSG